MLPSEAETTVAHGMERAGGELHHVVSHAGVRWWDAATGDDGAMVNELAGRENRLLGVSPSVFAQAVSKSAELHFRPAAHCECSCRLFTPPLRTQRGALPGAEAGRRLELHLHDGRWARDGLGAHHRVRGARPSRADQRVWRVGPRGGAARRAARLAVACARAGAPDGPRHEHPRAERRSQARVGGDARGACSAYNQHALQIIAREEQHASQHSWASCVCRCR
jgi:hypothetical protein